MLFNFALAIYTLDDQCTTLGGWAAPYPLLKLQRVSKTVARSRSSKGLEHRFPYMIQVFETVAIFTWYMYEHTHTFFVVYVCIQS